MSARVAGPAIAIVNSIGALGGFVGPFAMGWLLQHTHSYAVGLGSLAVLLVFGAGLASVKRQSPVPISTSVQ
jgi:nitrate/nitrite transporter NarK